MKQSIKQKLTQYLEEKRDWVWGGLAEEAIRMMDGTKISDASRRLRELAAAGIIEKRYIKYQEGHPPVVQYRIKRVILPKVVKEQALF